MKKLLNQAYQMNNCRRRKQRSIEKSNSAKSYKEILNVWLCYIIVQSLLKTNKFSIISIQQSSLLSHQNTYKM